MTKLITTPGVLQFAPTPYLKKNKKSLLHPSRGKRGGSKFGDKKASL